MTHNDYFITNINKAIRLFFTTKFDKVNQLIDTNVLLLTAMVIYTKYGTIY